MQDSVVLLESLYLQGFINLCIYILQTNYFISLLRTVMM